MSVFHLTNSWGKESIALLSVWFKTRQCRISSAFYIGNVDSSSLCCKVKEDMAMLEILHGFGMLLAVSVRRPGERRRWCFFDTMSWTTLNEVNKRHVWSGFFLLKIKGSVLQRVKEGEPCKGKKSCRNAFLEQMCQWNTPPSSATTPGTPSASRTDGLGYRPCSTATSSASRRSSCEARTHLRVQRSKGAGKRKWTSSCSGPGWWTAWSGFYHVA